ncbi:MAG: Hpt domain-containing protein [Alphaproteobacteria bacterium]|nr:Hpt domain-containing protein [Alphaproteobacteria bacterium]
MDDIIQDFLMETAENLLQLDVDLVALEQDHNNTELLGNIFRTIHTIKGTCGFIGLPRLEKVAHHGENVLDKFRNGDLDVTPDAITAILHCIDTIKEIMAYLEENGEEPEGDDTEVLAELNRFMDEDLKKAGKSDLKDDAEEIKAPCQENEAPVQTEETEAAVAEEDHFAFTPTPAPGAVFNEAPAEAEVSQGLEEPTPKVEPKEAEEKEDVAPAHKTELKKKPIKSEKGSSLATQNIRVNVELLENLVTSVSELVLARNQLLQISRDSENDEFKVPLQRLNHITSELQEGLMQTRMQPVGAAWSQLPRIVRDLSQDLKKEIDLEMIGADTELDGIVIQWVLI